MRRLHGVIGVVALCAGTVSALADDSWTGLYIGAHGGWATGEWAGVPVYDPGTGPFPVFSPEEREIDSSGWLGGGQIGFNKQSGGFVFGVEVDGSWTDLDGEETFTTLDFGNDGKKDYDWNIKTRLDWLGTARARLGILVGPALIYGTGGVAFGRSSADETVTGFEGQGFNPPQVTALASATQDHVGWVAGAGLEFKAGNHWTIGGQWLHYDLGDADYRFEGTAYPGTAPCKGAPAAGCSFPHTTDSFRSDLEFDTFTARVNYKFGE